MKTVPDADLEAVLVRLGQIADEDAHVAGVAIGELLRRRALEGAALVHVGELREWLDAPGAALGGYLDDLVRLLDLVDPTHAAEGGSREVALFERTIGIARLLQDDAVAASLVCRAAARLWIGSGGTVASFAEMAQSQATAEQT